MQTFREVREQDCYYVDKTSYIRRLLRLTAANRST